MFICPHCGSSFDINDKESEHQVNDHFDETFCSYECSLQYTREHESELKAQGLADHEIYASGMV